MYINTVKLSFQTRDANLLFKGKRNAKVFVPGFYYTQKNLNALLAMGLKENPYAEAALIEIDMRLEQVDKLFEDHINVAKKALTAAKNRGMTVYLMHRKVPYSYQVGHSTEYSNRLAKALLKSDLVFRFIRTAHTIEELEDGVAKELIQVTGQKIRMIYDRVNSYTNKIIPGITRESIEQRTEQSKTMIEKLGVPHTKIINRQITFKLNRIEELSL